MQVIACITLSVRSDEEPEPEGGPVPGKDAETDKVFKALADETRRRLLDRLHEHNGQTLGELCERIDMARQSVTQHLAVLEAANLVSTVRRGREKLHYLNPVPLHEIQERWIDKFERPRLRALERRETTSRGSHDRQADIRVRHLHREHAREGLGRAHRRRPDRRVLGPQQRLGLAARFPLGARRVRTARVSPTWSAPSWRASGPTRLVTTWAAPDEEGQEDKYSRVTFDIQPHGEIVRLTVTHEDLADETARAEVSAGWPAVLSNLKSLLETGQPLPQEPWLVP